MNKPYYMVVDVESVGLHGSPFWVGYVVVDKFGNEHDSGSLYLDPALALSDPMIPEEIEDYDWVCQNVPSPNIAATVVCGSARSMRDAFWSNWIKWRDREAWMAADVPWPVEGRFLNQCVKDCEEARKWFAPYPLLDVASIRMAKGLDPLATVDRLKNELPQHNPLADARQSARLLLEALNDHCI